MRVLLNSDGISAEIVSGNLYLCLQATREVLVLNHPAAAIWQELGRIQDVDNVVEALRARFRDTGGLEAEVHHFVDALVSCGVAQLS